MKTKSPSDNNFDMYIAVLNLLRQQLVMNLGKNLPHRLRTSSFIYCCSSVLPG